MMIFTFQVLRDKYWKVLASVVLGILMQNMGNYGGLQEIKANVRGIFGRASYTYSQAISPSDKKQPIPNWFGNTLFPS